jgi:DNA-binding beta-propeller fold protein YncE
MRIPTRRATLMGAIMAIGLAACTTDAPPDPSGPPQTTVSSDGGFLLVTSGGTVGVIDAATGSTIAEVPRAVPAPDLQTIATATVSGNRTTVRTLEASTGREIATSTVRGAFRLRAVSGWDGSVAMTPAGQTAADAWAPTPRTRTRLVVTRPGHPSSTERLTLAGNFEPEAFSDDGESLYLLKYEPPLDPDTYRVTRVYLETGKVWPVYGPDKTIVENMTATRLQQSLSPDGSVLYTLYTNQPPRYLSGDVIEEEEEVAFIHTLHLEDGYAVCVEMPSSFGTLSPEEAAITASPVGHDVYAVDAVHGRVVVMNAARLETVENRAVDLDAIGAGPISARVSADGSHLLIAGTEGIVALNARTLATMSTATSPSPITGLAFTADGGSLFVSRREGIGVLDPITLQTRAVLASPVAGSVQFAGV